MFLHLHLQMDCIDCICFIKFFINSIKSIFYIFIINLINCIILKWIIFKNTIFFFNWIAKGLFIFLTGSAKKSIFFFNRFANGLSGGLYPPFCLFIFSSTLLINILKTNCFICFYFCFFFRSASICSSFVKLSSKIFSISSSLPLFLVYSRYFLSFSLIIDKSFL